MKKTIGKPENWQDFESLCKKLWGEIWCIQNKIKKNGRQGQAQAGVDICGIPKGENKHWGIQCKGKDDYTNAKLSEKEILKEIENAKKFKPELEVFIIATTSNKDAKIEQFVREIDADHRKNGLFEVVVFCWEDIVDLLEENYSTLQWYLNGIGQKGKFDFTVLFNNLEEQIIISPTFEKEITKYQLTEKTDLDIIKNSLKQISLNSESLNHNIFSPFHSNKINKSWCKFDLVMLNNGNAVIEDWKFIVKFINGIRKLDTGPLMFPKLSLTTYTDDENKTITYRPQNNKPLIQKDNNYFEVDFLPEHNSNKIIAEWEILARDFNLKGSFEILLEPKFKEIIKFKEINKVKELKEDIIRISDYIVDKK